MLTRLPTPTPSTWPCARCAGLFWQRMHACPLPQGPPSRIVRARFKDLCARRRRLAVFGEIDEHMREIEQAAGQGSRSASQGDDFDCGQGGRRASESGDVGEEDDDDAMEVEPSAGL
eukprot:2531876-Prymnesium_polylepis.1